MRLSLIRTTLICLGVLVLPSTLHADTEFDYRGYLESEIRMILPGKSTFKSYRFHRNENTLAFTGGVLGEKVEGIFDLSIIYTGLPQHERMSDLLDRTKIDPYRWESRALYISFTDFLFEGLDLRVGRQIIQWGAADRFNPTNNLNPYDFEDPILFGTQIANQMVSLSYTAPWSVYRDGLTIFDEFTLQAVVVPIWRPSMLPDSSLLPFLDPELFATFVHSQTMKDLAGIQGAFVEAGGIFNYNLLVDNPTPDLENMQYGGRMSFTLLGFDLSASYYQGFEDTVAPQSLNAELPALFASVDLSTLDAATIQAIKDLIAVTDMSTLDPIPTTIVLGHTRVKTVGADMATSLDALGGLGLWAEFAFTWHEKMTIDMSTGADVTTVTESDAGTYWKVAAGMDYSLTSWWYMNVQYLHGFVDEVGSWTIKDYLVAGMDFKLFQEQATLRLFGIYQFQDKSYVLYPELMMRFWPNSLLSVGAYIPGGERLTKFGSVATGAPTLFMKARYSF
jgi:hypothetical protein